MLKRNEETSEEINGEEKQRTINSHEFLQILKKKKKSRKYTIEIKELKKKTHNPQHTHTKYLADYSANQRHVK